MHRVFCTDIPEAGMYAVLESREAEHLFKVFRARPGDSVELLDGRGVRAQGVVESGKMLKVLARETLPEPEEKLHLCCALPRKQKLDALLKQFISLEIDLLIAGNLPESLEMALANAGIAVISKVHGVSDQVLKSYLAGTLEF